MLSNNETLEAYEAKRTRISFQGVKPAENKSLKAILAAGGKKKNKSRKKLTVKKVGVYRSKGGYYYRRYKNGKVKRISKEIYKKLK